MVNERTYKKGDRVYFGRPNGEKTLGTVERVNERFGRVISYGVRQLEERGVTRVRAAGAYWRVHPTLVRPADGATDASSPAPGPSVAKAKRPDAAILADIAQVYSGLSPEYLYADGERSRSAAMRLRAHLNRKLRELEAELGRHATEDEAYTAARAARGW